jgi:SAM-dependent methyltransferase
LNDQNDSFACSGCGATFPVVSGIPILLSAQSVFGIDQVIASRQTYFESKIGENRTKAAVRRWLPTFTDTRSRARFDGKTSALIDQLPTPRRGLQVGAGERARQVADLVPTVDWLQTDVDLAYSPDLIADVTRLPLADDSFDVVYADQVLEHVIDIHKAASEIQRVLRVGGLLVVGIPFLYPFHGVPYDFFRVTPSGIRALFAQTENLHLDKGSGAWSALGLHLESRLINLFAQRQIRWAATALARVLFTGLKHLDALADRQRNLASCASLVYIGRKTAHVCSPREIMKELRAALAGPEPAHAASASATLSRRWVP